MASVASSTLPEGASVSRDDDDGTIRRAFLEHGFVVFRSFLPLADVAQTLQEAESLAEELPTLIEQSRVPIDHVQYDEKSRLSTLKQIQQLHTHSPFFASIARSLHKIADAALGESSSLVNVQYFNKPPTSAYSEGSMSKPTPPHQDGYYWMHELGVTMWLALDPADHENGCMRYEAGSADGPIHPHEFSGVLGFSQQMMNYKPTAELVMAAHPGDLLVHGAKLIHRAGANSSSSRNRRAVGAIYYGKSASFDVRLHEERQAEIQRRAVVLPGQRFGNDS